MQGTHKGPHAGGNPVRPVVTNVVLYHSGAERPHDDREHQAVGELSRAPSGALQGCQRRVVVRFFGNFAHVFGVSDLTFGIEHKAGPAHDFEFFD